MSGIITAFLPYLAIHTYTDVKQRRTSNIVNVIALLALVYLAYPDAMHLITALLYCLVSGLFLERMGVWLPGDTRMFAICGGYLSVIGVPPALFMGMTMLGYVFISVILLVKAKQMGLPNPYAIFQPLLRDKGVSFPGALLMTISSLTSWGVSNWMF